MQKDLSSCAIAFVNIHNIQNGENGLSSAELQQVSSFLCKKRVSEYTAGRLAARYAIGLLSKNFKNFDILNDQRGKPYVNGLNIGVSISHTKEYACAIAFPSCYNIGIDIEKIDPIHCSILQKLFRSNDDIASLTSQWCIRESLFKIFQHNNSKIILDNISRIPINPDVSVTSNLAYAINFITQCKTYCAPYTIESYQRHEISIKSYSVSNAIGISIMVEDIVFAIACDIAK